VNPIQRLIHPASTYMIDDGTAEAAITTQNEFGNLEVIWFNQFDVIPGQETIASVRIAWGSPALEDDINGTQVIIAIWSDPNGDGDPGDAVLLGSTYGTIVNAGSDTFVTYPFSPPVSLPPGATSFFVGDVTPMGDFHAYQALDENSILYRRSWQAFNGTPGAHANIDRIGLNDVFGLIDDFFFPGNWLIRADAGDGSDNITLTATPRRQEGKTFIALNWTPTDGGSINIIRNGSLIATVADDGTAQDHVAIREWMLVYQVCDAEGGGCSNQVRLRVRNHSD
jgi:hypothetical protein